MNAEDARSESGRQADAVFGLWLNKTLIRARAKIKSRVGAKPPTDRCEIDIKFPPRAPNDVTSYHVANLLSDILQAEGYEVRATQRVNHKGVICEIIWA